MNSLGTPLQEESSATDLLQVDPGCGGTYLREILTRVPWLLAQIDREPHSRTHGSCDRDQWSWKFRDHPLGMLQVAMYPLALLWRIRNDENPYAQSLRLLDWIDAAIEQTLGRQYRNGSFDGFAPNEQDLGPTLGVAHGLCEAYHNLGTALRPERRDQIRTAVRRACDFALPLDETHGFISNHQALFASTFLSASRILREPAYLERAERIIDRILEHQSTDGWYDEYGGPDPGYESLGIFHLAMYWRRSASSRVLASLARAVDFYAHCVHPDGSIGGAYGSRHTALYFPAGFEILAAQLARAAAVASFMRPLLPRANVVTVAQVDTENLTPLAYSYLEAAIAARDNDPRVPLPCQSFHGVRFFESAAVAVAGTQHYYALIHAGRGGIARVHARGTGEIVYEDAGYVVTAADRTWASQVVIAGSAVGEVAGNEVACRTRLGEVTQELLTPARFLLLRVLNLTLFRSPRLGSWIRRRIVARLITSRRPGPVELERRVRIEEDALHFSDRLKAAPGVAITAVALPRAFTGIHMGSAKYFHPAELVPIRTVDVSHMVPALRGGGSAAYEFTIRFEVAAVDRGAIHSIQATGVQL